MATAKCFEELEVWQEACELVKGIYQLTSRKPFDRDLVSQIRRAAVSIPSNIAEGFERNSNNEFLHFLSIAKGSAGELRTQLHLAHSLDYIIATECENHKSKAIKISSMISKLMNYLKPIKK